MQSIKIGTRKSPLALAQAEEVRTRLCVWWPALAEEGAIAIVKMSTSGDNFTDRPLADIGGKGLFTKEIEEALLDGRIDIAVHSMKDVPTELPAGLVMGAILPREDPRDMLVGRGLSSLASLPKDCKFGTSSLRRSAQLLLKRPDIQIVPLRGNVQTRLAKLEGGDMAATMLAMAGIKRLGLTNVPGGPLDLDEFIPAIAQGAIGIECRQNDAPMLEKLSRLNHTSSAAAVVCERAFLRVLDGSCRTPIAGHARIEGDVIFFKGLVVEPDGSKARDISLTGDIADAHAIGTQAGQQLKAS